MNEQAFVLAQVAKRRMNRAELQFTSQSVLDDMVKAGLIRQEIVTKPSKVDATVTKTYIYYSKVM